MSDDAIARLFVAADLVTPMALRVAATLRVADHVVAGRDNVAAIAAADGVDVEVPLLARLLQFLVDAGALTVDDDGCYALTPMGEALRDDHPAGMRSVLATDGALGRGDLAFVHLLHSLRTGEAAFPLLHGREFWADVAADAARSAEYNAQMGDDVAAWAPRVADAYDWAALDHVVDVGGGNGTLLAHLLQRFEGVRGTVLDQPQTVEAARTTLAAAGVGDRGDVVGGDFFAPWPAGADAYVLCAVLHDWADEPARAILRRGAEAVRGTAGRVLVVEKAGPGGARVSSAMDLRVLVYFGARERDVPALVALAAGTGLQVAGTFLAGDLAIVELVAE